MEVSGQLHVQAALPPWKEPLVPLDRRLGGPQDWSGRDGDGRYVLLCPCLESNPGRPASKLVTILTEIPHLPCYSVENHKLFLLIAH